jgi:hypothetical protein
MRSPFLPPHVVSCLINLLTTVVSKKKEKTMKMSNIYAINPTKLRMLSNIRKEKLVDSG